MAPFLPIITWGEHLGFPCHPLPPTQVLMKSFRKPESSLMGTIAYGAAIVVAVIGCFLRHSKRFPMDNPFYCLHGRFEMIAASAW